MHIKCINRFFILILSSIGCSLSSYLPINDNHQLNSDSSFKSPSSPSSLQYPLNLVNNFNQGALESDSHIKNDQDSNDLHRQLDHLVNSNVHDISSSDHKLFNSDVIASSENIIIKSPINHESSSLSPDHNFDDQADDHATDYINKESKESHSRKDYADDSKTSLEHFDDKWPNMHVIMASSSSSAPSSTHRSSQIISHLISSSAPNKNKDATASLFISSPQSLSPSASNQFDSISHLTVISSGHTNHPDQPLPFSTSTDLPTSSSSSSPLSSSESSSSSPSSSSEFSSSSESSLLSSQPVHVESVASEATNEDDSLSSSSSPPAMKKSLADAVSLFTKFVKLFKKFISWPENESNNNNGTENESRSNISRSRMLEKSEGEMKNEDKDEATSDDGANENSDADDEDEDDEVKRLFENEDALKSKSVDDKKSDHEMGDNYKGKDEMKNKRKKKITNEDKKFFDEKAREEDDLLDEVEQLISSIRSQNKKDDDTLSSSSSSNDNHPKNAEELGDGLSNLDDADDNDPSHKSRNNRNRLTVQMDYVEKLLNVYRSMQGMVNIRHIERGVSTPRLSVTSPIAVLRDALMEELRRKRFKEQQDRIKENEKILAEIG